MSGSAHKWLKRPRDFGNKSAPLFAQRFALFWLNEEQKGNGHPSVSDNVQYKWYRERNFQPMHCSTPCIGIVSFQTQTDISYNTVNCISKTISAEFLIAVLFNINVFISI